LDKDRKTVIADAAIALLASAGSKGLTHRAVDLEAGLPMGSTSYYCRTRSELLSLTLLHHAALDMDDLQGDARRASKENFGLDDFIDLLTRRVADWLSPAKRARLVARFELSMVASHEPDFAAVMAQQRELFLSATEAALKKVGVPKPAEVAPRLIVLVDGIFLDQISAGGPVLPVAQHRTMFKMAIGG
jgi:DNA-binding transcriptional regulator YbjK